MRYTLPILVSILVLSFVATGSQASTIPGNLNTNAAIDTGDDTNVSIAGDGSLVIAVWESTDDLGGTIGTDSDILYSRSTDGGVTWEAPKVLHSEMASDIGDDTDVAVATDGQGHFLAVWTSTENIGFASTDEDIFVSRSLGNGGTSWTAPAVLNSNAVGDCCATTSAFDRDASIVYDSGNWVVAWHSNANLTGNNRYDYEIHESHSSNDGATWSPVALLNNDAVTEFTVYDCCEDREVDLQASNGTIVAVWMKNPIIYGDDIFSARSLDGGATWSDPVNLTNDDGPYGPPSLATDGAGNWILAFGRHHEVPGYTGGNFEMNVKTSSDDAATWAPRSLISMNDYYVQDDYPSVATDGSGTWVIAWENFTSNAVVGQDILFAQSDDLGSTWTDPVAVQGEIGPDTGYDSGVDLAYVSSHWLLAWQSDDDSTGVGSDWDLLYTTCLPDSDATWQSLPGDGDCDGWSSSLESTIGTDPDMACGFTPGGDPASESWPPDLVESNSITISDILAMKPVFNGTSTRFDLAPSGGTITIADVLALKPFFGAVCTP